MSSLENSPVKTVDQAVAPQLFESIRRWAHAAEFINIKSPLDDVTYSDLVVDIPLWIQICLRTAIAECMGADYSEIYIHTQFARLTTESTPAAPHGAHNDAIHGEYSAFFYVNEKPEEMFAGTSLLTHKLGVLSHQPKTRDEWDLWKDDTNDYDAWNIDEMVFWEPNRLSIYPAARMHRAEPPGGWGKDASDGRLVLITFFSC